MKETKKIATLFPDIGGVFILNGWGHEFRQLAVEEFHLDLAEMEEQPLLIENNKLIYA